MKKTRINQVKSLMKGSLGRILAALLLIISGYIILNIYFIRSYTSRVEDIRKGELRRIVDLGIASLEPYRDEVFLDTTYLSMEQVRREGAITLRELTYHYQLGENYIFMMTTDGLILVEPFQRNLEFTNQIDLTDAEGVAFIRSMVEIAESDSGEGFIEYYYPRPGERDPQRKVSYIVSIPEWDALIGAGIYLGDADMENREYLLLSLLLTATLLAVVLGIISLALRPTFRSYKVLRDAFTEVGSDPDARPVIPSDEYRVGTEAWQLLTGFESMLEQIDRHKKAHEEATLIERNRLARELHDAVSQTLFSARLIADVLPDLWKSNPGAASEKLEDLSELMTGAHAELRTLLVELRPDYLLKADLKELLKGLADGILGRYRVPVESDFSIQSDIPPDVKIALFRIAQEALNNVVKHADADRIYLTLQESDGRIHLVIKDDGVGFDESTSGENGLGMVTMKERAEAMGADFEIDTLTDVGTQISVTYKV